MKGSDLLKCLLGLAAAAGVLLVPSAMIPIEGLTLLQHRVLALFVFAMCFWVLEPIPIFATSVLIVVAMLLFMSDRGIHGLRPDQVLDHAAVMHNFADPIIMLFLGGLFLGAAATKYRLDVNLGRVLLGPFGTSPRWVMLGMMLVTALFSMFMSNTATTAMMLAVLMPVLRAIEPGDPARTGFALSIPFAANIGGIGTPIGTPPNAVALKYLTPGLFGEAGGSPLIGFGTWMGFAVPFMLVLLFLAWALLLLMFRPRKPTVEVDFAGTWVRSPRAWVVYVVSLLTIGLWLTGGRVHGMSSPVVAMIPVGAFLATGVMDSRDLKGIGWDVLWLIAGGFALGMALEASGLAEGLVASIPFGAMPVLAVLGVACFLTWLMASFMSNTATANLMLPVMASLAVALPALDSLGGPVLLLLAVTFCASLSMILPISTPPNALAYASGWIRTPDMVRMGLAVGVMGGALLVVMLAILRWIGFFAGFGPGTGG